MQNLFNDDNASFIRLFADAVTSNDVDYLEDDFNNSVINEDINLNKAHYSSDYPPMETNCDDGEDCTEWLLHMTGWMSKPVVRWTASDTLAWFLTVAKENNLDCMGNDTNMKGFVIEGCELNQLSKDDFLSRVPKREFAMQLYGRLMKLKQNSDLHGLQSHDNLMDNYTDANHQIVPLISVSSSYDSGDSASLYQLQDDFERNDSGYEDPSDSELQLPILPMLNQQKLSESSSGDEWGAVGGNSDDYLHPMGGAMEEDRLSATSPSLWGAGEQSSSEEDEGQTGVTEAASTKKRPGRPRGVRKKKPEKLGRLWEFIRDLLNDSRYCPSIICWEDYDKGTFRFVQSEKVARLWGDKKENPEMNFEKFSRAMRYYYKSKVLIAVQRRLVYQFGPKAMIRQNQALQNSNHFQNGFSS